MYTQTASQISSPATFQTDGHKRRHENRRCKAHSPTARDIVLSKPAKWKHKRYQRIVNTQEHTLALHRSEAAPTVVTVQHKREKQGDQETDMKTKQFLIRKHKKTNTDRWQTLFWNMRSDKEHLFGQTDASQRPFFQGIYFWIPMNLGKQPDGGSHECWGLDVCVSLVIP